MLIKETQLRSPGHTWTAARRTDQEMPAHTRQRQSLVDLFHDFSKSSSEFLQYDNGYRSWKYTYAQVARAGQHFAKRLAQHNISKGDKVIIWSENRPEWVAGFWGCILAGAIL